MGYAVGMPPDEPTPAPLTPTSITITVRGDDRKPRTEMHAIRIPTDYALLEELSLAYSEALTGVARGRVAAAMISLCCPTVGRLAVKAGLSYAKSGYDPLAYGRTVYTWLHRWGVSVGEIVDAAAVLFPLIRTAAFSTEDEVAEELGK